MNIIIWVIVAIVVIGIVWYLLKNKGNGTPQKPEESTPPGAPPM